MIRGKEPAVSNGSFLILEYRSDTTQPADSSRHDPGADIVYRQTVNAAANP